MTHKHDWHWVGKLPAEGEYCSACGRIRDRDPKLPDPTNLRVQTRWVAR